MPDLNLVNWSTLSPTEVLAYQNVYGSVPVNAAIEAHKAKKNKKKAESIPGTIRHELREFYEYSDNRGTFGIEIEAETKSHEAYGDNFFRARQTHSGVRYDYPPGMEAWEGHEDNSLRNFGHEFVLRKPLVYEEALKALDAFKEGTSHVKFLKNTPSTSIHVHINMVEESFLTLGNYFVLWALFENVLTDFSGPTRRSNLFALPIRAAERTEGNIVKLFKEVEKGQCMTWGLNDQHMKYAALNIAPLTKIGSIEARSFRGTTDVSEIKQWLSILNRLLVYSKTEGLTPPDILDAYRDRPQEFFVEVFGKDWDVLSQTVQDTDLLVERNLWYALKIARSVNDWTKISTAISKAEKPEPKKKKISLQNIQPMITIDDFGNPQNITVQDNDWSHFDDDN